MSIKVVVTGASGFIGKHLVGRLNKLNGLDVIPVYRNGSGPGVRVESYLDTPSADVLIHLAENPSVDDVSEDYFIESGALLDSLLMKNFGFVIYASSASVYGDVSDKQWTEIDIPNCSSAYCRGKMINEEKVLTSNGLVARITNVIGPGMSEGNVLSDILKQFPGKGPIFVRDEKPIRDFIWVEDLVDAFEKLLKCNQSGIFNIGSGKSLSIRQLVQLAVKLSGDQSRVIKSVRQSVTESSSYISIEKLKSNCAWEPKTSLIKALEFLLLDRSNKHWENIN